MSNRKYNDYEFVLKLCHNKVITIPGGFFKQFNLIDIEFLLAKNVLQLPQYDLKKYARVCLFKSRLIHEIKKKMTDN